MSDPLMEILYAGRYENQYECVIYLINETTKIFVTQGWKVISRGQDNT